MAMSPQWVIRSTSCLVQGPGRGFRGHRSADRMTLFPVRSNPRWRPAFSPFGIRLVRYSGLLPVYLHCNLDRSLS